MPDVRQRFTLSAMTDTVPPSFAPTDETDRRKREVQLLINVIEPDPAYQPFVLTDLASVLDVTGVDEPQIRARLEFYLGEPFPVDLSMPVWQLVDEIKRIRSTWPE
jgi:hypothetical protein